MKFLTQWVHCEMARENDERIARRTGTLRFSGLMIGRWFFGAHWWGKDLETEVAHKETGKVIYRSKKP